MECLASVYVFMFFEPVDFRIYTDHLNPHILHVFEFLTLSVRTSIGMGGKRDPDENFVNTNDNKLSENFSDFQDTHC